MAVESRKGTKKSRGRLRIVAGIWRSRVLEIADVEGLRPTSERIRETLFNWLTPRLAGARCLDLFAGTGVLGLEALSRGAVAAVFVESSKIAIVTLRRNVVSLEASGAVIHAGAATEYIAASGAERFDIVFLDPPFAVDSLAELCRLIDESELLAANANVYLEQDRARPEPDLPDGWTILKSKVAGNVRYTLAAVGPR